MWTKLDDASWSHPKTLRVGNEAWGAFLRMVSYCSQHLTDGHLDAGVALAIAIRPKVLDKLVSGGLLERATDGFLVHDYLKHNPSREQVEADRKAKTLRQKNWRDRQSSENESKRTAEKTPRVDARVDASTDASTNASRDGTGDAAPSHPIPSHPKKRGESARASAPAHPRAPAREAPPPDSQNQTTEDPSEATGPSGNELVEALAEGLDAMWSDKGEPWRHEALGAELRDREFDVAEARRFGRFLAAEETASRLKVESYSPWWFVFGSSRKRAEFEHLETAVKLFDKFLDDEDARKREYAEQRKAQRERDEKKAKAGNLTPAQIAERAKEAKALLEKLRTGREAPSDSSADTATEPARAGRADLDITKRGEASFGELASALLAKGAGQ